MDQNIQIVVHATGNFLIIFSHETNHWSLNINIKVWKG